VLRGLEIIPISLNIAALAGGQDLALHPVPGDRFLAATSIVYDIPLVTRDQRLHEAEQVNTIW
jgi:PIN domain nuclease of toxin-antitoxin system